MKIYCLLSTENGPRKSIATADLFLHHEEALSAMKAAYERKLTALPFDVSLQTDWHRCSCEKDLASIIDGAGTYTWCVQEREFRRSGGRRSPGWSGAEHLRQHRC